VAQQEGGGTRKRNPQKGSRSAQETAKFKLACDGGKDYDRHLFFCEKVVTFHAVRIDTLHTAPIIRVNMDGHTRTFLLDTGSSLSLIQPGISSVKLTRAEVTPYGVTGDQLNIKGEQDLRFQINGQMYSLSFCVCALSTDADAIVGTDF
jgi:hypothetical protein